MCIDLFSIGPFTAHSYGLLIAIGIFAAYFVTTYRAKRIPLSMDHIDGIVVWILIGGLLGAKILYWMTQIQNIMKDPRILLNFSDGFVVYGGIIGGILAGYLFCRMKQIEFASYFDLLIPSVALAQGFGRIGCFLAGCCYGMETTSKWGIVFPSSSLAPSGVRLIPTQLIFSVLDFLLFAVLVIYAKRKKEEGQVAALYLSLYSVGRFFLEFLRGDVERGSVGIFSTSQFISIFLFAVGIALFLIGQRKQNIKNT